MNKRIVIVLAIALLSAVSLGFRAQAASTPSCRAIELFGPQEYDDMICAGVAAMDAKNYPAAVKILEKASRFTLFEYPNFEVLPRLALAYHDAGNQTAAEATLKKAELALDVLTRIVRCQENPDGRSWTLVMWSGGERVPVKSPYADEIRRTMCGEIYDFLYEPQSLDMIAHEQTLVRNYLDVEKIIRGH